MTIYVAP